MSESEQEFSKMREPTTLLSEATDFVKNKVVTCVMEYNRMKIQATIELRNIRKEYFVLDGLITVFECIGWFLWCGWIHLTYTRLEPTKPEWICVSKFGCLVNYYTADKYQYIGSSDDEYPEAFQCGYKLACDDFYKTRRAGETGIVVGSYAHNKTVVRLLGYSNTDLSFDALNVSSADFLSIEYHCESFPPIEIHIPIAHYLVGNQILSKEYVLRCLEHLPIYSEWRFNDTYRIIGIDDNVNTFVLDSRQYIELTENGYTVKILSKDSSCKDPAEHHPTATVNATATAVVSEAKDKIE